MAGAGASKAEITELINVRNNVLLHSSVISLVINRSENFFSEKAFDLPDSGTKRKED
jgi:hypothetical protein